MKLKKALFGVAKQRACPPEGGRVNAPRPCRRFVFIVKSEAQKVPFGVSQTEEFDVAL